MLRCLRETFFGSKPKKSPEKLAAKFNKPPTPEASRNRFNIQAIDLISEQQAVTLLPDFIEQQNIKILNSFVTSLLGDNVLGFSTANISKLAAGVFSDYWLSVIDDKDNIVHKCNLSTSQIRRDTQAHTLFGANGKLKEHEKNVYVCEFVEGLGFFAEQLASILNRHGITATCVIGPRLVVIRHEEINPLLVNSEHQIKQEFTSSSMQKIFSDYKWVEQKGCQLI